MSLRNVIGAAGAVVGYIYGGPQGAQWGWMIGSTVGGVIDPQVIRGPHLGEIPTQAAQEGGPRPIVLGRSPPIAGTVIAQAEPRIETETSSGKGGPKYKTEVVYRTYAVGFCEGPITSFYRVWRNGKKVYDAGDPDFTDAPDTTVSLAFKFAASVIAVKSRNEQFLEKARFFLGSYTQDASPDLEAVFGVGTTAAHRGTAYIVIVDEDCTDIGGAIPQLTVQIGGQTAPAQIFYSESGIWTKPAGLISVTVTALGGGGGGGAGRRGYTGPNNGGGGGGGGGLSRATILAADLGDTETVTVGDGGAGGLHSLVTTNFTQDGNKGEDAGDSSFGAHVTGGGGLGGAGGNQGSTAPSSSSPARGLGGSGNVADGGDGGYTTGVASPTYPGQDSTEGGGGGGAGGGKSNMFDNDIDATAGGAGDTSDENNLGGAFGARQTDGSNGVATSGYGAGGGGGGGGGSIVNDFPDIGGYGGVGNGADGGLYGAGGGGGGIGQSQSTSGTPAGFSLQQSGSGGAGAQGYVLVEQELDSTTGMELQEMVTTICARAGIPSSRIDVSLLPVVVVPGLIITNQYQAIQAIQALGEIYLFDEVYYDGKVRFIPRGGDSVATITEDDMLDDDEDIEDERSQVNRGDPLGIPRLLNLIYHDADATGLDAGKQTSERAGDRRAVGESTMQTPVLIDATTAARAVDVAHKALIERVKGSLKFSLPERFIELVPSNPIIVQWEGRSERAVIARVEQCDGYQKYECARDRQSAYTSTIEAIPLPDESPVPSAVPGPTIMMLIDAPALRDSDDTTGLGISIAVAGLMSGWSGAMVELSYDGGQNYSSSRTTSAQAVIGYLSQALGDHPHEYPDTVHTLSVKLASYGSSLSGTSLAGMLNRTNLAAIGNPTTGWEFINFADVEYVSDDVIELSYMLRGRKGTTARHHNADEYFVLLDRSVIDFTPLELTDLNRTLTFRATSFGTTTDTGTVLSLVYTGKAQTERAPTLLQAYRSGSNVVASWLGVGRLGGGNSAAQGQRFTGYRVTFTDGVTTITTDTTAETLTEDVSSLSGAVTISVVQLNSITGAGPAIEVTLP